jgi:hypothetical protein
VEDRPLNAVVCSRVRGPQEALSAGTIALEISSRNARVAACVRPSKRSNCSVTNADFCARIRELQETISAGTIALEISSPQLPRRRPPKSGGIGRAPAPAST